MKLPRSKVILSVLLSMATLCVMSFSGIKAALASSQNTPIGVVNGTGTISINGNKAVSGASAFSGNTITTGNDGVATIDLQQYGRVIVRQNTSVTLTIVGNSVQITENGKNVTVAVMSGNVQVLSAQGTRTLQVSQQNSFGGPVQLTASPGSVVVIQEQTPGNHGNKGGSGAGAGTGAGAGAGGGHSTAPWWSFLLLGGVAGGIAAGVATHGGESKSPTQNVSPSVP